MCRPRCLISLAVFTLALLGPAAAGQPARLDAYGDPLPDGALLRLGTSRLQTGGRIADLVFSRDGKTIITANRTTGVHVWEVATGKELHHLPCDQPGEPEFDGSGKRLEMVLSPDGTHVATAYNQGVLSIRAVASGNKVRLDKTPWKRPHRVEFAPNNRTVVVAEPDQHYHSTSVHHYEVATGKLLNSRVYSHGFGSLLVAFSPDGLTATPVWLGNQVHVGYGNGGVKVVELAGKGQYGGGALSPDGQRLAAIKCYVGTYTVHVIDLATGKCAASIDEPCRELRFTADGKQLVVPATIGTNNAIKVFDAATGKHLRTLIDGGRLERIAVSPDGKYVAGADFGTVRLRHLDTGRLVHPFPNSHAAYYLAARFAADGKTITATNLDISGARSASVWDATDGRRRARLDWPREWWPSGSVSADGSLMSYFLHNKGITVAEVATNKVLMKVDLQAWDRPKAWGPVACPLRLSPDGKVLMGVVWNSGSSYERDALHLWDVATGKKLLDVERKPNRPYGYFDGSGRFLITVTHEGTESELRCHDAATGRLLPRGVLQRKYDKSVSEPDLPMIAPDGRLLVSAPAKGGPLTLRELATDQVIGTLPDRGYMVSPDQVRYHGNNDRLAFSPDGRFLAAATTVGIVLVWDLAAAEVVAELKGHRTEVTTVSWSSDGRRLVSSGQDMTLVVWDAAPWRARAEQAGPALPAKALEALWQQLASGEAANGHDAVRQLVRAPKQAVALLRKHLPPAGPDEAARIRALFADLNSTKFTVREKAQAELEKLGDLALPGLEHALTSPPTLEARRRIEKLLQALDQPLTETVALQQLRALTVLESLGTAEARALLKELAAGAQEAWRTREARATLGRLLEPGTK